MKHDIEYLEDKIRYAAQKYYSDQSVMTDDEFDSLVDELRVLDPRNELLSTVGFGYSLGNSKIRHSTSIIDEKSSNIFIGSLPKYKNIADIDLTDVVTTPKFDGISIVMYYRGGKLVEALTRGDGYSGLSMFDYIRSIPQLASIRDNSPLIIRGELIVTNESWQELESISYYKNQRNAISGIMNSKNYDYISYITFAPYKIMYGGSGSYSSDIVSLSRLYGNKDNRSSNQVVNISKYTNFVTEKENLSDIYSNYLEEFPCDGLVMTEEDIERVDSLSTYSDYAFKFESESEWTTVLDIEWNKTRLGKYVPVVLLDPIELSGATVSRVSAFNAQYIIDNKISKGTEVLVTRSNEVIPYILEISSESDYGLVPSTCSLCSHTLKMVGVDLVCDNRSCKSSDDLLVFISTNSPVKGLGSKLITRFLEEYNIESIGDIDKEFWVSEWNSCPKDLSSNKNKFIYSMYNLVSREVPITTALVSLNIPNLGYANASKFNSEGGYELVKDISLGDIERAIELLDFATPSVSSSMLDNLDKLKNLNKLNVVLDTPKERSDSAVKICITGRLEGFTKKEFIERCQGRVEEVGISSCEFLVKDDSSNSSKTKYALDNSIPTVSSKHLLSHLGFSPSL